MARRFQSSFSAGEIDPALQERTTLDKYSSGLKTARNVYIGKTGRIISRQGTKWYKGAKEPTRKAALHFVENYNYMLE